MIIGDDRWYQVADLINTAVYNELTLKPGRSGVVPGMVAWDDCCSGTLATTWALIFGSDVFPQEQSYVTGNCDTAWEVAEIVIQLIRCAPTPSGSPNQLAPSVASLASAARQMAIDVTQSRRAAARLLCTMKDDDDIVDFKVNRHSSLGPEGGCVGIELRMYVGLPRNN